jgi:ABC-2 type transport system permease protein
MILLFTAIFATISVIEDRREGFLKSVLVAPVPRSHVVLGKALGSATIAFVQAAILLPFAPLVGFSLHLGPVLVALLVLFVLAFALSGLGLAIAWSMDSTQGFHAIMNFFLLPMWLLSGAFFPPEGAPGWLVWAMRVNPVTYGLAVLRGTLLPGDLAPPLSSLLPPLLVSLVFAAVTFTTATLAAARKPAGGVIL